MIEREIGEVFTYLVPDAPMNIKLQVVEDKRKPFCMDCEFEYICRKCPEYLDDEQIGPCVSSYRKDKKSVKFIRLGTA